MAFSLIGADGSKVPAEIFENLDEQDFADAQSQWVKWRPRLKSFGLEHYHWDWPRKAEHLTERRIAFQSFGIKANDIWQGLCLAFPGTVVSTKLNLIENKTYEEAVELLYVDYIASAPWNLKGIDANLRLKGVGKALWKAINKKWKELRLERLGLESLPQSEAYYLKQGFELRSPRIEMAGRLAYFEGQ